LIVRDLDRGISTTFGNVAEAEWQPAGPLLAMIIHGTTPMGNGVRTFDPAGGVIRMLESDTAQYRSLSWREKGDELAVLRIRKQSGYAEPAHDVIAWRGAGSRDPERSVL